MNVLLDTFLLLQVPREQAQVRFSDLSINPNQHNHSTYPETPCLEQMLHNLNVWHCPMIFLI